MAPKQIQLAEASEKSFEEQVSTSFLDYSMSVIADRALPDVRDGLKPVHRRILWAMYDGNIRSDRPHVKCARVVGNVIGFFHPHGDGAAYESLVRLAQWFSLRVPLIDPHGNFGTPADPPAAQRYTECRLSVPADRMLDSIDEDTVDFMPNFDGSRNEPRVLPAGFPNLLVNGAEGIAVGISTRIPPHNLREVAAAAHHLAENPKASPEDLMAFVKGPDFPTGGLILEGNGLRDAYINGRGTIRIRARHEIESDSKATRIVLTEMPYQVAVEDVAEKAEQLVEAGTIQGVRAIRNESAGGKTRLVLELRSTGDPDIVLNNVWKSTKAQTTYPIQFIALTGGVPRQHNLADMLRAWLDHREEVIRRRTQYRLDKAEARLHIIEGLLRALDMIEEIIAAIRASKDRGEARQRLTSAPFDFTEIQANHILDMPLGRLTQLGRSELDSEAKELRKAIRGLRTLLKSKTKRIQAALEELDAIVEAHGSDRKTSLSADTGDIDETALVQDEPLIVTVTARGYLSAAPAEGRGNKVASPGDRDVVTQVLPTSMLGSILVFTDAGKCYKTTGKDLPSRKLTAAPNLFSFGSNERVVTVLDAAGYEDHPLLCIATDNAQIKRVPYAEFSQAAGRKDGLVAMGLTGDARVIAVFPCPETFDVVAVTALGQGIHFDASEVRPTGRSAAGVRATKLGIGDRLVDLVAVPATDDPMIAIATTTGWAKRMRVSELTKQARGGKGLRAVRLDKRSGEVAGMVAVVNGDDLLAFDAEGDGTPVSVTAAPIRGRDSAGTASVFGTDVSRLVHAPDLEI